MWGGVVFEKNFSASQAARYIQINWASCAHFHSEVLGRGAEILHMPLDPKPTESNHIPEDQTVLKNWNLTKTPRMKPGLMGGN